MPLFQLALFDDDVVDEEIAELLARVDDAARTPAPTIVAGIADLAAGFAVERRLVEDQRALLAGVQRFDFGAVLENGQRDAFGDLGLVAEEFGGAETLRRPNQIVSVAASPEPDQALRASARWRSIAEAKPSVSTPRPRARKASCVRSSGKPNVS